MVELIIQSGKLKGKRLVLPAKEMIVGRDEDCDLRIASSLVSRKHCVLKNSAEGILVTDLSSQNGTHVNDIPISEPTLLREGDTLRIGATVFAIPQSTRSKAAGESRSAGVSEADIFDWLSDSAPASSGNDTAVIGAFPTKGMEQTPLPPTETPTPVPTPKPKVVPPPKALSVKDEAALIIRKHWESVKAKQKR